MSLGRYIAERPPPAEGIWFCRRCMRERVFITSVECEGRSVSDAPLYCEECGWEKTQPASTIIPPNGQPMVTVEPMSAEERAAGRERLRLRMLAELGPGPAPPQLDEVKPVDQDDLALQISMLTRKGRAA